jgi:glycerophosphoryl diester phosphodiesterase
MYSGFTLPLAISHRGLHAVAPENSLAAFRAAIEAGADGIELDVHASSDDILYVQHDPDVEVDGSSVPIRQLDSRQISRLRGGGDERIPTLDDALATIGSRCDVFIEIKATGIEHAVTRCLKRHVSNSDRYAVHAFDHRVVKRVLELMPGTRTGMLQVSYLLDSCGALRRTGASDLWQHSDFIDQSLVIDVHSCGGRVVAWTPNTAREWDRLTAIGVDGICTDAVDDYVSWRNER